MPKSKRRPATVRRSSSQRSRPEIPPTFPGVALDGARINGSKLVLLSVFVLSFMGHQVLRGSKQGARGLPRVEAYEGQPVEMPAAKVVGGRQVRRGRYKYAVSLQCNKVHYCGGSLISADTVLTAAHCVSFCDPSRSTAVIGTTDLERPERGFEEIDVAGFIAHPGYESDLFVNDIAVVKLATESKHTPVLLDDGSRALKERQGVTVVGWGVLEWDDAHLSSLLQELALLYMTPKNCANHWPFTSESYLCAWVGVKKPIDSSTGDSGGPLIQGSGYEGGRHVQVGVTSFGTIDPETYPGKPSVYSRVSQARDFIEENAKGATFVRLPRAPASGGMLYLILYAILLVFAISLAAPHWFELDADFLKRKTKQAEVLLKRLDISH